MAVWPGYFQKLDENVGLRVGIRGLGYSRPAPSRHTFTTVSVSPAARAFM